MWEQVCEKGQEKIECFFFAQLLVEWRDMQGTNVSLKATLARLVLHNMYMYKEFQVVGVLIGAVPKVKLAPTSKPACTVPDVMATS